MQEIRQTGLKVAGFQEQELKAQLEMYCDGSAAARHHLQAAGSAGVKIESSAEVGQMQASGTTVRLFRQERTRTGVKTFSLKELAESALFEIQNALNADRQPRRGLTLLRFGKEMCDLEAESTAKVAEILGELAGYTPSAWGAKQVEIVGGKDLSRLKPIFASRPHNASQPGKFQLVSAYFYAYVHGFELSGNPAPRCSIMNMRAYLEKIAKIGLRPGTKVFKGSRCMSEWQKFRGWGLSNEQFFVSLILAVNRIGTEPDWNVTWLDEVPGVATWVGFAEAMAAAIPGVTATARVDEIGTALKLAIRR